MPPLVAAIVVLTLMTGGIHLYLGIEFLRAGLPVEAAQFIGMAAPYLIGAILVAWGVYRRLWLRLGAAYVVALLALWAVAGARTPLAYADKLVELVLLALLAWAELDRRTVRSGG